MAESKTAFLTGFYGIDIQSLEVRPVAQSKDGSFSLARGDRLLILRPQQGRPSAAEIGMFFGLKWVTEIALSFDGREPPMLGMLKARALKIRLDRGLATPS